MNRVAVVLVPSHSHSLQMANGKFVPIHFHEVISGLMTLPVFRVAGLAGRTAKAFAELVNDCEPGNVWMVDSEVFDALCAAARTATVQPSHAPAFLFLMDALFSAKWLDSSTIPGGEEHPSDERPADESLEADEQVLTPEARAMMAAPVSTSDLTPESNKPLAGSIAARSRK